MTSGKRYVRSGTVPMKVPFGRILIHNHIDHTPDTACGDNGFRAWTDDEDKAEDYAPPLVECDCGWAYLLHYRVKGPGRLGQSD